MILQRFANIVCATSVASDGNMSFLRGNPKDTLRNRKKFLSSLGLNLDSAVALTQIHGARIIKVGKKEAGIGAASKIDAPPGDGLITNEPNIYLMIKGADCHQIAIYDPTKQAIALIHAGRTGLEKSIVENAVKKMVKNFGSKPKDLIAQFGPSIGPCCYRMDIWKKAEDQLTGAGVLKKNIDNPKICTYHTDNYFSHRRSEDQNLPDYRFMTVLGIQNAN